MNSFSRWKDVGKSLKADNMAGNGQYSNEKESCKGYEIPVVQGIEMCCMEGKFNDKDLRQASLYIDD